MKVFYPLFLLLLFTCCIDEEVSNQPLQLTPEYSLPIGFIESDFKFPPMVPDSANIGRYGFINIYGKTYPNNRLYYTVIDDKSIDFKNTFTNSKNIVALTLKVIVNNSYPAEIKTQLYFLGTGGYIRDSLLRGGMAVIEAAGYNQDQKIIKHTTKEFIVALDSLQIHNLTRSKGLEIKSVLKSTGPNNEKLYITSQQNITMDIGMRIKMKIGN